jgi:hypothetical protein
VSGVSAGANLACHVALTRKASLARDYYENKGGGIVKGIVLVIPWLIINEGRFPYQEFAAEEIASRIQCARVPVLSRRVLDFFVDCMGGGLQDDNDINPDVGWLVRRN